MTGIAGATNYQPTKSPMRCWSCGIDIETPYSARGGVPPGGAILACSAACKEHPRFRLALCGEPVSNPDELVYTPDAAP